MLDRIDYIASVRFSAEGQIEARDGDVYRAASPMTYTAGWAYRFDGPMSLASNGDIIAYATTQWSQIQHPQLWVFTSAGTEPRGDYVHLVDDSAGIGGDTIVDGEGRVLMNVSLRLHPSNNVPMWPILATFAY